MAYGQKRLNRKDVQRGTRNFIISFLILCGASFLVVFMFFKSAQMQSREITEKNEEYSNLISRNEILNAQLDVIYEKMSKLSDDDLTGDNFRLTPIIDEIVIANKIIEKDSTANLKQISILLKQMSPMINYKNVLQQKIFEENNIKNMLSDCLGTGVKVKKVIKQKQPKTGDLY